MPFVLPPFAKIAFLVAVMSTAVFGVIAWQVAGPGPLPELDRSVASAMRHAAADQPWLREMMVFFTLMGSIPAMAFLAAAGAAWQWRRGAVGFAVAWAAIVAGGGLATLGLKAIFDRERPLAAWRDPFVHETNESFPSGHSMGGMIGYGMLAFALVQTTPRPAFKVAIVAAAASCVGLIGFSRIYLRAHWLSDVAAGWLIGIAWLALGLGIWEAVRAKPPSEPRPSGNECM